MATEKKASSEHWTAREKVYYKQNRATIDRELIFDLAKRINNFTGPTYTSTGYMVADELLRVVRKSMNGGDSIKINKDKKKGLNFEQCNTRSKCSESSQTDEKQQDE